MKVDGSDLKAAIADRKGNSLSNAPQALPLKDMTNQSKTSRSNGQGPTGRLDGAVLNSTQGPVRIVDSHGRHFAMPQASSCVGDALKKPKQVV
jgi:hypothetical protein